MAALSYVPVVAFGEVISRERFPDFLEDLARLEEGVITQAYLMDKWRLCPVLDVPEIVRNDTLKRMVRIRKHERKINGAAARELARVAYPDAVGEVGKVVMDKVTPPKVKIDGARELRQMTGFDDVSDKTAAERFTLTIIVGDTQTHISNGPPGPQNLRPPMIDAFPNDEDDLLAG
jgi:hypothetical protein